MLMAEGMCKDWPREVVFLLHSWPASCRKCGVAGVWVGCEPHCPITYSLSLSATLGEQEGGSSQKPPNDSQPAKRRCEGVSAGITVSLTVYSEKVHTSGGRAGAVKNTASSTGSPANGAPQGPAKQIFSRCLVL